MVWEHLEKNTGVTEELPRVNSESGIQTNLVFSVRLGTGWEVMQ